jgi:putative membrane protein
MRNKILAAAAAAIIVIASGQSASAQMMRGNNGAGNDDHTKREEAEGKEIWEKMQKNEKKCADLTKEDFGALGEYFMGQMIGKLHPAMNAMMEEAMGKEGEEAMHTAMGKRLSGCDPSAAYPNEGIGFMPMMNMMGGGLSDGRMPWSSPFSYNLNLTPFHPMMYYGSGFSLWGGLLGVLLMVLWWVLILAGIAWLVKWIMRSWRDTRHGGSALDVLKERYARGEIDRKEFEEKKRDLLV